MSSSLTPSAYVARDLVNPPVICREATCPDPRLREEKIALAAERGVITVLPSNCRVLNYSFTLFHLDVSID
ncbi:MAG: hypothetical protein ACREBC_26270, partial [Pyrinomonadaceae bacterium]